LLRKAVSAVMLTLLLTSMLMLAFNVQLVKADPLEVIIDTHGDSRFTKYPSGPYWWSVADHDAFHTRAYNNNFWYTYCGDAAHGGDLYWGKWDPPYGQYEVSVWIPNPDPFDTYTPTHSANYDIYHSGGFTEIAVNQALRLGGWYSLGSYTFVSGSMINLDDRTGEPYTSTMVAFDAIKFTQVVTLRTLTVSSAHDSPNPSNGGHSYSNGQSVTCSVSSPVTEGGTVWTCTGWSGTGSVPSSGSGSSVTFTITQDSTITWNWQGSVPQRTLTVSSAHDSPNPSNGQHTYNDGSSVTCSVTSPADQSGGTRYRCTGYTGTGSCPSGTGTSVTFAITQDSTIVWNWAAQYSLTVASAHDSPSPSVGTWWYDSGASLTCSVTSPAEGYSCTGWTGTGSVPSSGSATSTSPFIINQGSAITWNWIVTPPVPRTLTVYSSPSGVSFTANGVSHTTPWSGTYNNGDSVSLVMPSTHTVGEARYYWDRWSDGITSRSRTVVMDTDITLTAYYTGPYYQLTVTSSPIIGVPFTINGISKTTTYAEWLLQSSYTVEMPATYSGYTWSHWLEDGDTNRIKTFTLSGTTTLTAVYTTAPPPNQPPYEPTAASQYRSDGTTVIPEGGATPESTVVFKATVSDPDGDSVRLEIELRQIHEAFTGEPTLSSDLMPSGSHVSITRYSLVESSYKWRYRAKDSKGATSNWVEFGTQGNIDFISSEDVYWLAKTIINEAEDCTDQEKIAVGWTVRNRLNYPRKFIGNSIKEIVLSGYTPNWRVPHKEPTDLIVKLAKDLLEGKYPDPTEGATSFFSPRSQTGPYIYPVPGDPEKRTASYAWWAEPIRGWERITVTDPITGEPIEVIREVRVGKGETTNTMRYVNNGWEILSFDTIRYLTPTADHKLTEYEWKTLDGIRNWQFMFYRPYVERVQVRVESPVELRVYDAEGHITGLVNGEIVEEIPGSEYYDNTVTIDSPSESYRYVIIGVGEGLYSLTVVVSTKRENITLSAIDIPTSVKATHQYTVDWITLSFGEEGATVQVDSNGDEVFEHTFTSDSELTQSEFLAQITHYTFSIIWGVETFIVSVESNSTVSNFAFNQPGKEISFNVTGEAGTLGFCNVTIPKALLYGEPWTVLIDGAPVPATITENATHSFLYFTYTHSTHEVQIIGTWVVPPPPTTYSLTITTTVGGTTNPAPGTYSYIVNSIVQVTAIPEANYIFDHWELDTINVGSATPYSVLMDNNHTLKAVFTYSPPPPSLSASISPLSASILVGQSVTFTSTVSGGYTPYSYQWYLNGNPVSGATSNTWAFTPTTGGIYYVYLKVTDAKNNTTQSQTARITAGPVPVGGYSIPIQLPTTAKPVTLHIALLTILIALFIKIKQKTKRKH